MFYSHLHLIAVFFLLRLLVLLLSLVLFQFMDKRPEITLVTNKQVQQPVMDRYQQHGMSPLTQEQKPAAKVVNDNTPQTAKEPDYLDIPAFLRKQAD